MSTITNILKNIRQIIKLAIKEICLRRWSFITGTVVIATAVAMMVLFYTSGLNSQNETRALTLQMGFNLRIVPATTDMDRFWTEGFSNRYMEEESVLRFGESRNFSFAHLTAMLSAHTTINGGTAILTGVSSKEIEPSGKKKKKMTFAVPSNHAIIGYSIADKGDYTKGDSITIEGERFAISETLVESGTSDDATIYLDLPDAQRVLKSEGKINEIRAINCMCILHKEGVDPLQAIRDELAKVLPGAIAVRKEEIAKARERQRVMSENYFQMVLPIVILATFIWVMALSYINTNSRKKEIGILRAMGYSGFRIAALFAFRAKTMGLIGGLLGYAIGSGVAVWKGQEIFLTTANSIKPLPELLLFAIIAAPLLALIAALLPLAKAVTTDTTSLLRER